jgi:uncharacterized protein (TIGR02301 family)
MMLHRLSLLAALLLAFADAPAQAQFSFPWFQQSPESAPYPENPRYPRYPQQPPRTRNPEQAPARTHAPNAGKETKEEPVVVPSLPAPFDKNLQRLAEILGALHYLRPLCGSNEGQKWRQQVQSLIAAETPTGERRDRMVASFNRGFRGFQQTYRSCTPAADYAIRRYLDEGAKIARDITARYAN